MAMKPPNMDVKFVIGRPKDISEAKVNKDLITSY
jgi:hypothetical protein